MSKRIHSAVLDGLKVRLPGLELAQAAASPLSQRLRLGWYIKGGDIHSASTRYRCFHFARLLEQEFENLFISNFRQVKNDIRNLDALIIVKRLDRSIIDLAALARHAGKPLFLDLCDDVANPRYPTRDDPYLSLTSLIALAPVLNGIVVPSAEMAGRVEQYFAENGLTAPPRHVIPDIAETRVLFEKTRQFVRLKGSSEIVPPLPFHGAGTSSPSTAAAKRLIWFGNYGGSHSNFGIFSLKSRLKKLRDFHREVPIELTVVSNSLAVYEALVSGCGFPTRYVPWSPSSIYDELQRADVALLTTGDDDFCDVKSSNRVLQALAASVPVITEKSSALSEFEEVIFSGKFRQNLEECLGPDREANIRPRLKLAASLLQRYTPERLASQWATLLKTAIGRSLAEHTAKPRSGLLIILDVGDDPDDALATIRALNAAPGVDYDLLVSLELLEEDKTFNGIVHAARPLPMFFTGTLEDIQVQVARRPAVIIGSLWSVNSERVEQAARELGVEILTHMDVAEGGIERFSRAAVEATPPPRLPPGPFPERDEPDGSVEWAFVIHSKARGWILDAICQEIGSRQPKSWKVIDHSSPPPAARNIFFSHFSLLDLFASKHPEALATADIYVWYTHPREEQPETIERNLGLFSRATKVIFTCESNRRLWIERGLDPARAVVVLGAADPSLFRRHARGGGVVGLSSSFYERKNPDLLLEVVKALPHRNFVLLGRHWNRFARFEELLALPNFTYLTKPYKDYPWVYATFDVFLSISSLEGGPIPLIEAMMCNAVPVASRTGFAPDLIQHGRNGFLFEIEEGPARVSELIEQAFTLDADVRATVEQYSWDNFSAQITGLAACTL